MSQSSYHLGLKLKPSAWRMFWPTLILAATSFGVAFSAELLDPTLYEIALWSAVVVVGLFWLLPLLSFLAASLRLDSNSLSIRSGFLGLRKQVLPLAELSSIEIQKGGVFSGKRISIFSVDGSEVLIRGYARTKLLAAEIEALAKIAI